MKTLLCFDSYGLYAALLFDETESDMLKFFARIAREGNHYKSVTVEDAAHVNLEFDKYGIWVRSTPDYQE